MKRPVSDTLDAEGFAPALLAHPREGILDQILITPLRVFSLTARLGDCVSAGKRISESESGGVNVVVAESL